MPSRSDFLSGGKGSSKPHYMSDINVTPFVDVMLVLLIVFMVAAPMMATGIKVDLPQARTQQVASDLEPVEISIDAMGQIYVGEALVAPEQFAETLAQLAEQAGDPTQMRVFVGADRSIDYGAVMGVVAQVANAGFTKVAFLSDSRVSQVERAAR